MIANYLDDSVSLERSRFNFEDWDSLLFPIGKDEIWIQVANITKNLFTDDVTTRGDRKKWMIEEYVNTRAIWHKPYLDELDLWSMPLNPSDEVIETELNKLKYYQERMVVAEVRRLVDQSSTIDPQEIDQIVSDISIVEKTNLTHYVCMRKLTLDLFKKSFEIDPSTGEYRSENYVHSIIFPTRQDTITIPFHKHNLRLIDEKLNFVFELIC